MRQTDDHVMHIDGDLYGPGDAYLLYANSTALMRTHIHDSEIEIICGGGLKNFGYAEGSGSEAKFKEIRSFVQVNKYTVILTDRDNSMIRRVARTSNTTVRVSGSADVSKCPTKRDGDFDTACFKAPTSIVMYSEDVLFVAEEFYENVRKLQLREYLVTTVISSQKILGLFLNVEERVLYGVNTAIHMYRLGQNFSAPSEIKSADDIIRHKNIDNLWFPRVTNVIQIHNTSTLLISEFSRSQVYAVNTKNGYVQPICAGNSQNQDGSVKFCSFKRPGGLYQHNSTTVFIGTSDYIKVLTCKYPTLLMCTLAQVIIIKFSLVIFQLYHYAHVHKSL